MRIIFKGSLEDAAETIPPEYSFEVYDEHDNMYIIMESEGQLSTGVANAVVVRWGAKILHDIGDLTKGTEVICSIPRPEYALLINRVFPDVKSFVVTGNKFQLRESRKRVHSLNREMDGAFSRLGVEIGVETDSLEVAMEFKDSPIIITPLGTKTQIMEFINRGPYEFSY